MSEVVLAAIAGAHGIGGEVRLKLFAQGVDSLKRHKTFTAGGRTLTLVAIRAGKAGALARFAEVADRTAAEALRGTTLSVPRDALPPLAEGEYYHADLIGRPVVLPDGTPVGAVIAVQNFGAGDILDIARPDGRTFMVPFKPDVVLVVAETLTLAPEFAL